jgi:hypothetical protein
MRVTALEQPVAATRGDSYTRLNGEHLHLFEGPAVSGRYRKPDTLRIWCRTCGIVDTRAGFGNGRSSRAATYS